MPPLAINVVAAQSDTGKTTVLEKLIPLLKQKGLRIGALKGHLAHYDLDLPGKDTWRYTQAGAEVSGMTSAEKYILIGTNDNGSGMEAALERLQDLDLVLIEGNKKSKNPKIEILRKAVNENPLLSPGTFALVSDCANLNLDLPVLALDDSEGLAKLIMERFFSGADLTAVVGGDELTHFDQSGRPRMVDVSAKKETGREAYARGEIRMQAETLSRILSGDMAKGDVLGVAQVAAVMAVKETGRLIPMAHPLSISGVEVDFRPLRAEHKIEIGVRVKLTGQTGVEMEALTGVSIAALTIYDMCKAIDKEMTIENIRLVEKKGGRSGHYRREQ